MKPDELSTILGWVAVCEETPILGTDPRKSLVRDESGETELTRRCDRNRKRSKRRAIYCPIHGCYLDSVSQKHHLFADQPGQLQQRGIGRLSSLMLIATNTAVPLQGEWLEAFWCDQCQEAQWYHVRKTGDRSYDVSLAPQELWQQATGVINTEGNPSVSEFSRKHANMRGWGGLKDFKYMR